MVKNVLRKIYGHATDFWSKLGLVRKEEVVISGLGPEEKAFKQSILEECQKALAKARKEAAVESVSVHVKSSIKGSGKMYELKASLSAGGEMLHASACDRDLYAALRMVLAELFTSVRHFNSLRKNKRVDKE